MLALRGWLCYNLFRCCVTARKKASALRQDRGLVKWYDRGLQNLWWEFDSLIPCKPRKVRISRLFEVFLYLWAGVIIARENDAIEEVRGFGIQLNNPDTLIVIKLKRV